MNMYYVPPTDIEADTFLLRCQDSNYFLDTQLECLEALRYVDLLAICKKIKVRSRRRSTKERMVSEIRRYITFEIPEGPYIVNY
jgi:hypothetical protein